MQTQSDRKTFHLSNVLSALEYAIAERSKFERETLKYAFDSGMLGGLKELVSAIKSNEDIAILDENNKAKLISLP
jgi:hypothetical protein